VLLAALVTFISHACVLAQELPATRPTVSIACVDANAGDSPTRWADHLSARLNVHYQADPFVIDLFRELDFAQVRAQAPQFLVWRASLSELQHTLAQPEFTELRRSSASPSVILCPPHELLLAPDLHEAWADFAAQLDVPRIQPRAVLDRLQYMQAPRDRAFFDHALSALLYQEIAAQVQLPLAETRSTEITPSGEYRAGAGWNGQDWTTATRTLLQQAREWSDIPLVFLGDSITQGLSGHGQRLRDSRDDKSNPLAKYFAEYRPASLGFSGDRTEHLRYRIRAGALKHLRPRLIVLQIGINNLNAAQDHPQDVVAGIEAVFSDLRQFQPQARILVCGPLPAGKTAESKLRKAVDETHRLLQRQLPNWSEQLVHGRPAVIYADLRAQFIQPNGEPGEGMAGDALHLNARGKEIWMSAIAPLVHEVLQASAIPHLKQPLAWLASNDDYPRLSRRVMVLEPQAAGPRCLAQPLLYSFDSADHQQLGMTPDTVWVNGPISWHRDSPNQRLPLHAIRMDGAIQRIVENTQAFAVNHETGTIAWADASGLYRLDPNDGSSPQQLVDFDEGRMDVEQLLWADGELYARFGTHSKRGSSRWHAGIWKMGLDGSEAKCFHYPTAKLIAVTERGLVLARLVVGAQTVQGQLTLVDPGPGSGSVAHLLREDLRYDTAVAIDAKSQQLYYINSENQLCSSLLQSDAPVQVLREIDTNVQNLLALGSCLAFQEVSQQGKSTIRVLHIESNTLYDLGPGIKLTTL